MKRALANGPQRQRGVALVTAILMVAIATALAAKMVWDSQIGMRRTQSLLDMEQAQQLALGAEAVAISLLLEQGADFGNFAQDISEPIIYEANIEDVSLGIIQGRLIDMQGRLNINNLVVGGAVNEDVKKQLQDLLGFLQLDPQLVDLLSDWIDSDTIPQGAGAEDGSYTSLQPPYRPANNYLLDISELRAIGGLDKESYELLLPHVTAIPPGWCGTSQPSKVNINFSSAEVIAAVTGLSPGDAANMVQQRDQTPWEDINSIGLPPTANPNALDYIDVKTSCFALSVIVDVGRSTLTMYSLLDRAAGSNQIVPRVRAYGLEI